MSEPIDLKRLIIELEEFPQHYLTLPVLVRTQDGRRVWLTIQLTDIRYENEQIVLVGDLSEVD